MQKTYIAIASLILLSVGLPAYAHESRTYQINGISYGITVGSLGEPVVVDDKSGLDLTVTRNGQPFVGAEEVLKVEIGIGDTQQVFDISTVYGAPGKYKTTTFFTETKPLSYRIFGTLENKNVDLSFVCAAAGHQMHSLEDATRVDVSDGVVQTLKRGAFGCVAEKSEYEFPSATSDQRGLADGVRNTYVLGGVALLFALAALVFRGRSTLASSVPALSQRQMLSVLAVLIGALVIGYGVYAFSGREDMSADTAVSHGAHPMKEIEQGKPIPTVAIEAIRDSKDGYNIHVITTNYTFTPETVGGTARANTGHAHLYVNDVKVARLYGSWFNLGNASLATGENRIKVTLNADDHSEWARDGEHIAAEVIVTK